MLIVLLLIVSIVGFVLSQEKSSTKAKERDFAQRVIDLLDELNRSRSHAASVAHRSGRVSVVGIGLDDVERVAKVLRERIVMRHEVLLTAALMPRETSSLGILAHIPLRKGETANPSQLRVVHNFILEEVFDALDLLLAGLIEEPPFAAARKNLVVQRIGDSARFMHIALPTLIPVEQDDGTFKGDANYVSYEPLVHELTYHLEHRGVEKNLSTKPNRARDSAEMWLALLRGLVTVGIDTIEHENDKPSQQPAMRNLELVTRLRKILASAQLGSTITAAGNWLNAQHLFAEWRARLLVGAAMVDNDIIGDDKPITFLVPHYLAATVRNLVAQHGSDKRLGLEADWTEDTILAGIEDTEDDDDDEDDSTDTEDAAPAAAGGGAAAEPASDKDEL
jgi:hypothetical protein